MDKEIAIVWYLEGEFDGDGWVPDTSDNRTDILARVDASNKFYGHDCHWMIVRSVGGQKK